MRYLKALKIRISREIAGGDAASFCLQGVQGKTSWWLGKRTLPKVQKADGSAAKHGYDNKPSPATNPYLAKLKRANDGNHNQPSRNRRSCGCRLWPLLRLSRVSQKTPPSRSPSPKSPHQTDPTRNQAPKHFKEEVRDDSRDTVVEWVLLVVYQLGGGGAVAYSFIREDLGIEDRLSLLVAYLVLGFLFYISARRRNREGKSDNTRTLD